MERVVVAGVAEYRSARVSSSIKSLIDKSFIVPDNEKAAHYAMKIGEMRIVRYAQSYMDAVPRGSGDAPQFDDILHLYKFDRKL